MNFNAEIIYALGWSIIDSEDDKVHEGRYLIKGYNLLNTNIIIVFKKNLFQITGDSFLCNFVLCKPS